MLVAALMGACGDSRPMAAEAGSGGDMAPDRDSGALEARRDAGRDSGMAEESGGAGAAADSGGEGGESSEAGNGGDSSYANGGAVAPAPLGGQGGEAAGGTPAQLTGGQPAPAEHVLWSQSWTVAIHNSVAWKGYKDATMGLFLDAGDFCKFGFMGATSGSSQEFATDGACISEAVRGMVASGSAVIFDSAGMNAHGSSGNAPLSGWTEAVTGHTVTKLRRTQTYTIQLLGSGDTSYNYADFEGKWEAIGK